MGVCEVCGNDYEMTFEVITAAVPIGEHCSCKILGHGIEARGYFYCCAHCARAEGEKGIVDHV
jgi:hypothetical protein